MERRRHPQPRPPRNRPQTLATSALSFTEPPCREGRVVEFRPGNDGRRSRDAIDTPTAREAGGLGFGLMLEIEHMKKIVGDGPDRCRHSFVYSSIFGNLSFEALSFGVKKIMQFLELLNHAL